MPEQTEVQQRDRAMVAFTILTGARDGAIASLKLAHIDIGEGRVDQDAAKLRLNFPNRSSPHFFQWATTFERWSWTG